MNCLKRASLKFVTILVLVFVVNCKAEESEPNPVLVVNGENFRDHLWVQIVVSVFLGIAYVDFCIQTLLLLYVFFELLRKARKCSEIFFAIFGLTIYIILRSSLLPVLINPIPWDWAPVLPDLFVQVLTYINMATFAFFYGLAALASIYYIVFIGITGKKMGGSIIDPKTGIEPMVVILMPIYNEEPDALFRAVESAIRCNYRPDRLHVFLAFDEGSETSLYFALLKKLKVLSKEVSEEIKYKLEFAENDTNNQLSDKEKMQIFPPRLEWFVEGVRVTICRFPHEGKSPTQGKGFKIINEIYGKRDETAANTLILFIDSDIILHENAIHNFVTTAVTNPKIKGMTGLVTCRTSRRFNIYQYMQDAEYIDGQMFQRTAEATLGAVTCLPGALTLIRLNALQKVAPEYFIEIDKRRTVDFHRYHLGEDRYMTYLLTEQADGPYQVRFVSSAMCKTDAPDTFQKLLKQRRRWFLGGFVNDISTIMSPVMWMKVPIVVLMKVYFYSSRGIEWILPLTIISVAMNTDPGLAMYLLVGAFGIRYLLLCLNALLMSRNKVGLSYILLFFTSPFFNWLVTMYALWTWSVRSWGGPRTDADSESLSQIKVLDDVMAQKEEGVGKTRKSLGQIKAAGRIMETKLRNEKNGSPNDPKLADPPVKKFVPFPYETEFLGGGEFDCPHDMVLVPPSPTLSTRSLRPLGSPLLTPNTYTSPSLNHSNSMSDLNTLTQSNAPYLFSKLSPDTQRRASSFRLDTDYLATVEDLATRDTSGQRGSSFNLRLSGRSSPLGSSREPSVYNFSLSGRSSPEPSVYNFEVPPSPQLSPGSRHNHINNDDNVNNNVSIVISISKSDDSDTN